MITIQCASFQRAKKFFMFLFFLYIMLDIKMGFVKNVFKSVSKEFFCHFSERAIPFKKGERGLKKIADKG